jgi:hypothetical protein
VNRDAAHDAIADLASTRPAEHEPVNYEAANAVPTPFSIGDYVSGGQLGTEDFDTG